MSYRETVERVARTRVTHWHVIKGARVTCSGIHPPLPAIKVLVKGLKRIRGGQVRYGFRVVGLAVSRMVRHGVSS